MSESMGTDSGLNDPAARRLDEAFMSGDRSDALPLVLNDSVRVTRGEYAGQFGAVVSIVRISPDLSFLVESFSRGQDVQINVDDLEHVDPHA